MDDMQWGDRNVRSDASAGMLGPASIRTEQLSLIRRPQDIACKRSHDERYIHAARLNPEPRPNHWRLAGTRSWRSPRDGSCQSMEELMVDQQRCQ